MSDDLGPQPPTDKAVVYRIRVDGAAVVLRLEFEVPMTSKAARELGMTLIIAAEDADKAGTGRDPDGEADPSIWQGDR